ncbi:MAG: HAD hydrolase-like protein [Clostridia bacterium]|nr:HAD hydrolase-like protein [Clostridia bacterium]
MSLRYKCLVLDHDDTVVNSTATIHYPCFVEYMEKYQPQVHLTLEEYFRYNFDPGVIPMFTEICGLSMEELYHEEEYWREYTRHHVPKVYPGFREILQRQREEGGLITVVSHSFSENILRDYGENELPLPDQVYGWEYPSEQRKPSPWPLRDLMVKFDLQPEEMIVIDDLKPGYDMAQAAGVPFAGAGWANDIPEIETFMRKNCDRYFKTIAALKDFLFTENS